MAYEIHQYIADAKGQRLELRHNGLVIGRIADLSYKPSHGEMHLRLVTGEELLIVASPENQLRWIAHRGPQGEVPPKPVF